MNQHEIQTIGSAITAIEAVIKHFTRTPSTLKDSEARGQAHETVRALKNLLEQSQCATGKWTSLDEKSPPKDPALDDPSVLTERAVLVTNNIHAKDRMGRHSHVWFAAPMKTEDGQWVAFDESCRKIEALTHWLDPFEQNDSIANEIDPDFVADLNRSKAKHPGNKRLFDAVLGEVHELKRAYEGDGDIRAEAFDVAVCAYRIATEGDGGENEKLAIPDWMAWGACMPTTDKKEKK